MAQVPARMINTPKGPLTESQFRQAVANNEFAAGPGGTAAQQAIDSGSYTAPQAGTLADGSKPQTGTSGGGATAAKSTPTPSGQAGKVFASNMQQTPVGNPDAYEFAVRPDDSFSTWSQRFLRQGMANFGPGNLNPFVDQNPDALLPYQQWFYNRYGQSAGLNNMVATMLNGGDANNEGQFKGMAQKMAQGNMGPADSAGAMTNLQGLDNMIKSGNHGQGSPTQILFGNTLHDDPALVNQYALAQFSGMGGPLLATMARRLNSLQQEYTGSVKGQGPAGGTYMDMVLKMLGAQ